MTADTLAWWTLLRGVAGLNLAVWAVAAWALWHWRDRWPPHAWLSRRWQLLLSAGYVLGCGHRSMLLVGSFWLWGLCAAALVFSLAQMWRRVHAARRPLLLLWCLAGSAYVAYMGLVDVPMYLARWTSDEMLGRPYFTLAQGLVDVSARWTVSHDWAHWRTEVIWMSAYFSVAVWISVALVLAPQLKVQQKVQQKVRAKQPLAV
jgi:hypothetical protein